MAPRIGQGAHSDAGRGFDPPRAAEALTPLERLAEENDRLRATIDEMRARTEALQLLADTDTLTPLANRRRFLREIERALASVRRYGTPAFLLFADVDGLKAINDRHGHAAGDAALIHVAQLLLGNVRATDLVARIAGDEFGILLDQLDEEAAQQKMERLAAAIAASPLRFGDTDLPLAATLGLTRLRPDDSIAATIARADAAMYAARRNGRSAL